MMFGLSKNNKVIHHHNASSRISLVVTENTPRREGGELVIRDKRKRRHCIQFYTAITTCLLITTVNLGVFPAREASRIAGSPSSAGSNSIVTLLLQEFAVNNHTKKEKHQLSTIAVLQQQHQEVPPHIETVEQAQIQQAKIHPSAVRNEVDDDEQDADCPFRHSPIYRKVFVYPNHGDVENGWSGSILSDYNNNDNNNDNSNSNITTISNSTPPWPWLEFDLLAQRDGTSHYDITSTHVQYTTELLVRHVMTHPNSCLRTYNPDQATLFYVPYLSSVEHHHGSVQINDYTTSPYGRAILDILDHDRYDAWEYWFGFTSKYWKRRRGADHILVFSEPLHGLFHPKLKRGNFHYIHSQKQLSPPIVISIEQSTSFVARYPRCARKNILMPYPNTDGRWFNGYFEKMAANLLLQHHNNKSNKNLTTSSAVQERPMTQYFSVGLHGTCTKLRKAMTSDYSCSPSFRFWQEQLLDEQRRQHAAAMGMLLSTFCPCPGGDSPSAKRMFDAVFMGCIPIIISADFVWPFSMEFDAGADSQQKNAAALDPNDFALQFLATDYNTRALDPGSCQVLNATRSQGLQARLDAISATEIQRLRHGLQKARDLYSWYQPSEHLVDNPLRQGVLPDGGAAHALVQALAERANGVKWPACEQELQLLSPEREEPKRFQC